MHACCIAGASYPAGPLGYPPQSGNHLITPMASALPLPTVPEPAASLLTDSQHKIFLYMKKALRVSSDSAKLKSVRLSLKAACVHIQQAASNTGTADTNFDK